MSVAPGWHVDPAAPETRRYWDGEGWIGEPIPLDVTPPDGPPPAEPESPPPPVAGAAAPGQPGVVPGADPPPAAFGTPPTGGTAPGSPGQPPGPPGAPSAPWPGYPAPGTGTSAPGPGLPGAHPPAGLPGAHPPAGLPGAHPPPGMPGGPPAGWPWPGYPYPPPPPRPHGMALAGFGPRLVARLIDFGIVFLLNAVVNGWFVWQFIGEIAPLWREVMRRSLAGDSSTDGLPQPGDQAGGLQVAILVIATALWFAYEVPALANSGQTLGKRVMRIKVLPVAEGQQLGFGRAFRRWNTLGLPTLLWYCCGFGLLLQLVDALSPLFDRPLRQALHDKRAQTVVVQVPRADPAAPTSPAAPSRTAPSERADPPGDAE